MRWWKSEKTLSFRIFLVALILRLIPVLATPNLGIGLDDMFQYDMLARSIVAGNGYRWYAQQDLPLIQQYIQLDLKSVNYDPRGVPTSFRPPLYPAFLALIYLVVGTGLHRFFFARLVQALLAAALAPLTLELGRQVFPERSKVGVIAAWVVTFYPMLVIYPLSLATENLFFVLVLASTLVLLKAANSFGHPEAGSGAPSVPNPNWFTAGARFIMEARWFILAGLLLGLTALTRSVALGLTGMAVLWIWFGLRRGKMAVLVLAAAGLMTVPWMIRNTLLDHRLTGIESALGYDLYVGYNPRGTGTFQYPISLDLLPMVDDGQRDAIGRADAIQFIAADPGRFPYLVMRRAGYFFGLERRALTYFYSNDYLGYIPSPWLYLISIVVCTPFILVSLSSAFGAALVKRRKEIILLALIVLGYVTPHLFIIAEDRFHLAIVPFLALLAANFWTGGWPALRTRWQTTAGRVAIALACLVVLLLCSNWVLELWRDSAKLVELFGTTGNMTYFSY